MKGYDLTRTGRRSQRWATGGAAVGTRSQVIPAWRSGWGPGSDGPELSNLRCDARSRSRWTAWGMLAAAGVDGPTVRTADLGPPVRRGGQPVHPERSARADRVAHARRNILVRQRWQRETVHAVIKRTFGDTLRSRQRSLQRREPISNGVVSTCMFAEGKP
ncbi:MAG: hypothetical protein ACUVSZ_18660 [Chloroflexus sp.]|uniref:hypothetical protein n=1 Tax=Chloroflexus sp. TaxID=1904827 RepID=UPI0040494C28